MPKNDDRLTAIQKELNALLEERIGDLTGNVMALQEVVRQIASTETEIRRQETVRVKLDKDLETLTAESDAVSTENAAIQEQVDALQANVTRMRTLRDELMTSLSGLTGQLKGLAASTD